MPSIYLNYAGDNPCPYHRFLLPARYLSQDYDQKEYKIDCGTEMPHGYDWYGIHGIPRPEFVMEIGLWRQRGAKFLWSLDDDFLTVPDWNPAKPRAPEMASWELCKRLSDLILVSTPVLAKTFSDVSEKVVCAPNLLEVGRYMPPRVKSLIKAGAVAEVAVEKPIRIVWVGGHTHREDVDHISPAIDAILRKYGSKEAHVIYAGLAPSPGLLRDWLHNGLIWQPGVPFSQYHRMVESLSPDIWIAPQVDVPFNHSKCVVGDTLIPTENGIRKMRSLVEGMAKTVRLENHQQMVRTWFKYENRKTLRVETASGYVIEGTPHHRIRMPDGDWKALESLSLGDEVEIARFDITQREYQTVYYPAFLGLGFGEDLYDKECEQMMPRIIVNENWGRFFGYLMGDGHVAPGGIGMSCSTEYPDIIDDVKRLFHGMGLRTADVLKGDARRRKDLPAPKGIDIKTHSVHLRRLMERLGISGLKGKVFEVPQVILDSPKSVIREFLRGLFEADGTVSRESPMMSFTSKSEVFARQVQTLLLGFGIKSKLVGLWNKRYQRHYWNIRLGRQGCDLFHAEIGFISQKKNERLRYICSRDNSNAYKEWEWSDPVTSITNSVADVFDIEVAHDHYYLANGFVSHNSNLRIMEGWSMLGAVVASPVGEYHCLKSGIDGRYASTTEEWVSVLSRLINDHPYRMNMAVSGRERVAKEYDWARWECRRPWHEVVSRIFDCDLPTRRE